jgi:hypothetical protein
MEIINGSITLLFVGFVFWNIFGNKGGTKIGSYFLYALIGIFALAPFIVQGTENQTTAPWLYGAFEFVLLTIGAGAVLWMIAPWLGAGGAIKTIWKWIFGVLRIFKPSGGSRGASTGSGWFWSFLGGLIGFTRLGWRIGKNRKRLRSNPRRRTKRRTV